MASYPLILRTAVRREVVDTVESALDTLCAEGRLREAIRLNIELLHFVRFQRPLETAAATILHSAIATLG